MEDKLESSIDGLKGQVKSLEKQVEIMYEISEGHNHSDDLIEIRLKSTSAKIKILEEKIEEIHELIDQVQKSVELAEKTDSKKENDEDLKLIPVTVVIAIIGFFSGPMVEIIKYLLRK